MLLPKFEFHEVSGISEACQILSEYGATAKPLAGGTDLLVNMKRNLLSPAHLVSLAKISELKQMSTDDGMIRIGAGVTVADIIESEMIQKKVSALAAGAAALGSPLIRNLATIGGNIGSARPAADLPPSLMAYGAQVVLKSVKGERKVPLAAFFRGAGLTEIMPDELITEFQVPVPPEGAGAGYINLGVRKAHDCNIVNVASFLALNADGTIQTARIVFGCCGPTHLTSANAEKTLLGNKPDEKSFEAAAQAAQKDSTPIDDFRGSAEYKSAMVKVLTKRTLDIALEQARKGA